jgi:serine/threonine protein kinase
MDTERNLLFGLLALRSGLINDRTLIDAVRAWSADQQRPLADVLTLDASEQLQINSQVDDLIRKCSGDAQGALWGLLDDLQSLPATEEPAVRTAIFSILNSSVQQTVILDEEIVTAGKTTVGGVKRDDAEVPYSLKSALPSGPRYTRTLLHASGGMGSVWLAHDAEIGRDVALKELRAENLASASIPLRFLREARITGQLEHPGIVPVYELGHDPGSGQPYYTMRFVRGHTLTEAVRSFHRNRRAGHDDPLEFVNLLTAFVSVCHTIAYAHSHGIIHRDLKGENIVLGDYGEVIVLDWGLAKRVDHDDDPVTEHNGDLNAASPGQTVMGQVMGTPAYMSPEQAQGRLDLIGPPTDIFGSGAIFYEILAGRPPFAGTTTIDVIKQASEAEVVPPRVYWPDVPSDLEAICLKALSRAPADRHATATQLARQVQGWQDKQRRQAEDELRQAGERLMQQQVALVRLTRSEVFSAPELTTIFRRMIEVAARTLDVERVGVWRYTDDRSAIRCELLFERTTGRTSSGTMRHAADFPNYFAALETNEVIPAHDARTDPRTSAFTETYLHPLGIGAIMDAPIHVSGELYGVVCHEHVGPPRKWMPDEQLFAIAIANLVSQAVSLRENQSA